MRRINEIFYSLQGEGRHAGEAALFIRFSGCNLKCPFCDTLHQTFTEMEDAEIIERVKGCEARLVVLTGGEPSLWIDEEFVAGLKRLGKYISVETNGTHSLPSNIDWITLSPKAGMTPGGEKIVIPRADEIKVVNAGQELDPYFDMAQRDSETLMYLQPCYVEDAKERQRIIVDTISKVKRDPRWRLSVQLHRMLNIQ